MRLLLCDGTVSTGVDGQASCSGTWASVEQNQYSEPGMTPTDYEQMKDATLSLFVVVFGFLALKKALS